MCAKRQTVIECVNTLDKCALKKFKDEAHLNDHVKLVIYKFLFGNSVMISARVAEEYSRYPRRVQDNFTFDPDYLRRCHNYVPE